MRPARWAGIELLGRRNTCWVGPLSLLQPAKHCLASPVSSTWRTFPSLRRIAKVPAVGVEVGASQAGKLAVRQPASRPACTSFRKSSGEGPD